MRTSLLAVTAFIILVLAFVAYRFISLLEFLKEVKAVNDHDCFNIRGATGIEDIVKFEGKLLGSSNDNIKMYQTSETIPNGQIVIIDLENKKIEPLYQDNFPKDHTFHPNGIYLFRDNFLYVINHTGQGDNVEVLQVQKNNLIEKLYVKYLKTIKLPDFLRGITNDLVVINDDEFYITTWKPEPFDRNNQSLLSEMFTLLKICLNIKQTYVYHCINDKCEVVEGTSSLLNNGITYDCNDKIYLANTIERKIRVFQIDKINKGKFIHLKDIDTGYAVDNVEFDKETEIITAGIIGKMKNHLDLVKEYKKTKKLEIKEMWGGSLSIDTRSNDLVSVVTMSNNKLNGISSSLIIGKTVYLSSFADDGILVCKIK